MNENTIFKRLTKRLSECTAEDVGLHEGVASVYSNFFESLFKTEVKRIYGSDGYWKIPEELGGQDSYMLTEYKYGKDLKSKLELSKVLSQCAYYLHKIVNGGKVLPKVVFVGDENECVILSGKVLWDIAENSSKFEYTPSNSAADESLLKAILESTYIENLFVFDMDETCDMEGLVRTISNLSNASDGEVLIEVSEHNIDKVWANFKSIVFGRKKGIDANEQVSVFVHYITDHEDFLVDDAKGKFSLNGKSYKLTDPKRFKAFRQAFGYVRSVKQKAKLRATCDRFIEDMNRRKKGEFYTPTAFVDYAHQMISKEFGENWKDEYVVWDCAWGTGNLTRDYKFKELYCSTLEQGELDIARNVNPDAVKFRYDFLNDDFEKLPEGLKNAFREGKKILFLINPPYATAADNGKELGRKQKVGVAATSMNREMVECGLGRSAQNLYGQFLYRISKFKEINPDVSVGIFCPPLFLTGPSWSKFRSHFLNSFGYASGILFQASHFSDVASSWGIMFSIWKNGTELKKNDFEVVCIDVDGEGEIVEVARKILYNTDTYESCSEWLNSGLKRLVNDIDSPQMKSALKWGENSSRKYNAEALGYYVNAGNNVNQSLMDVALLSSVAARGCGFSISRENFDRVVVNYSARKLIQGNWINAKDEFLKPNLEGSRYEEYFSDSVIFSIFYGSSNQSSLRNIEYKGKLWNIKNEFFWMPREEIMELADSCGLENIYEDASDSEDRFVYKKLQGLNLSPEAQDVLEKASEILRKSFQYRKEVHSSHPEFHLNAWDAGWYQIKKLVNELPHLKKDMEEFKELFRILSDKMRPMVYELGFLKK